MKKIIYPQINFNKTIIIKNLPGDKSISHRSILLSSIASGNTEIYGFLKSKDCFSTIDCLTKLGINIKILKNKIIVEGKGLYGLSKPNKILDVGNSGTTLRLLSGLLSAQNFSSNITGDYSIQKRPMNRIFNPLSQMGAIFKSKTSFAPFKIEGTSLEGINYTMPIASAQVKSAILIAGLYAKGETIITEPQKTRNHTEIMLNYLGADIKTLGNKIICKSTKKLYAQKIYIPGDISSAAYLIVATCICKNLHMIIENICLNPTRTGIIDVLKKMGADININKKRIICGEYVGNIEIKSSKLKGIIIEGDIIPRLIDEIPIIAVAACFADGETIIKNAQELKVKESNRIKTITEELNKLGANISATNDGLIIKKVKKLTGNELDSHNDHRIAMSIAIAALKCDGKTIIKNAECTDISFPNFFDYITNFFNNNLD